MTLFQLEDFLPSFTNFSDQDIQLKFTLDAKYAELKSDVNEPAPSKGKFFKHQTLVHRALSDSEFTRLLTLSEPGTGKTCEISGFTEKVLSLLPEDIDLTNESIGYFRKVFILVNNSAQKKELRNQLICKCSGGRYLNENIVGAQTEQGQKSAVTRTLRSAGYEIWTHKGASNKIENLAYNNKKFMGFDSEFFKANLHEMFDNSIIWIDEAHNLNEADEKESKEQKEQGLTKEATYAKIFQMLHEVTRTKQILSTATPMINSPKELSRLMNLILPLDGQLPENYNHIGISKYERRLFFPDLNDISTEQFEQMTKEEIEPFARMQIPDGFDFVRSTLEEIEPYFRGKVTYVRAADNNVEVKYQGNQIDYVHEDISNRNFSSQVFVVPSRMSDFQYESYLKSFNESRESGWRQAEQQAANAVFPDGRWGVGEVTERQEGGKFGSFVTKKIRSGAFQSYFSQGKPKKEFLEILRGGYEDKKDIIKNISKYSAKIAKALSEIVSEDGNVFVFDELVQGSGLLFFGACLEAIGFERFEETSSVFLGEGDSIKSYCTTVDVKKRIRSDFKSVQNRAPYRYALLTEETVDQSEPMFELLNSNDNIQGDYLKVLLCARVGREGINVSNVKQIHLLSSSWNQSNNKQAEARGLRATSHVGILQYLKNQGVDITKNKFRVNIYNHVALGSNFQKPKKGEKISLDQVTIPNTNRFFVDVEKFLRSEEKDISIREVMRKLKQISLTCNIHYQRNVRKTDIDGSPTCDYQQCAYHCFQEPEKNSEIFEGDYLLLYSEEQKNLAIEDIKEHFRYHNRSTFEEISQNSIISPVFISLALEKIVLEKIPILNRFGYSCYLVEDNLTFLLTNKYPIDKISSEDYIYTQSLIAIQPNILKQTIEEIHEDTSKEVIRKLESLDPESEEFSQMLHDMDNEIRIKVLEDAYQRKEINKEKTDYTRKIVNYFFKWFVYRFRKPETTLIRREEKQKEVHSGRKTIKAPKIKNLYFAENAEVIPEEKTPYVYLHTLGSQNGKGSRYSTMSKFNKGDGNIRILESDFLSNGWRTVEAGNELIVYNQLIQNKLHQRKEKFEENELYGIVDFNGEFRIIDQEKNREAQEQKDARKISRGKTCATWSIHDLYNVLYRLRLLPSDHEDEEPVSKKIVKSMKKNDESFENIVENAKDEMEERYFATWYIHRDIYKKEQICEIIYEDFEEQDLILNLFPK